MKNQVQKTLTEKEAEDFLEEHGFQVIERELIKKKQEIASVKFSFPWVMKISSRHIVHKAKIGGTILNIKTKSNAEKAFDELMKIEKAEGVMIQPMMFGEELILGLKKTKEFGLVVMFGKGGSKVEEEKDVTFRVPKIDKQEAEKMIADLKFSKQITGETNIDLIIENIIKMSNLALEHPEILELDINPLIVNKAQAQVVDARIITA